MRNHCTKIGSKDDEDNYRGIALLRVLGKLFTRILNNRLTSWAEYYYVYIKAQADFGEYMSTVDKTFALHDLFLHVLNSNIIVFCCF